LLKREMIFGKRRNEEDDLFLVSMRISKMMKKMMMDSVIYIWIFCVFFVT